MIELLGNLSKVIEETKTLDKLNKILENIVLNLIVDDKKILKLELKEPFNKFIELKKDSKVLSGGRTKS